MNYSRDIWAPTLAVVLIGCVVYAADDCATGLEARGPVNCYECSTEKHEHFCGDPFNATVPNIKVVVCQEACAKWLMRPKFGPTHVIRTCASSLNMDMQWSTVCMKESRPGDGRLCFCNDDRCNSASTLRNRDICIGVLQHFFLGSLALLFIYTWTSGHLEWWTESLLTSSPGDMRKLLVSVMGISDSSTHSSWIESWYLRKVPRVKIE